MVEQETAKGFSIIGAFLFIVTWILVGLLVAVGFTLGRYILTGKATDWSGVRRRITTVATWPIRKLDPETEQKQQQ